MLPPGSDVDNPPVAEDKVEVIEESSPVAESFSSEDDLEEFNFESVDNIINETGNDDGNSSE
jgi:hypothetical protein